MGFVCFVSRRVMEALDMAITEYFCIMQYLKACESCFEVFSAPISRVGSNLLKYCRIHSNTTDEHPSDHDIKMLGLSSDYM